METGKPIGRAAAGRRTKILLKHVAVPAEHGAWVFLFSPLLAGLALGKTWNLAGLALSAAVIAAFLGRAPLTVVVKILSKRRPRSEMPAALFWLGLYGMIALAGLAVLALEGFGYIGWLALAAIPALGWHLWLVSRRDERRKPAVEIVASGVLALSAPAAVWIGAGEPVPTGWLLWILFWLQAAASIVYAYMRLAQRVMKTQPSRQEAWQMGRRALLYTGFNLAAGLALAAAGVIPLLAGLAFLLQFGETLWGITHPAVGYKPAAIGVRQMVVSILFTLVFTAGWLAWIQTNGIVI